MGVSLRDKRILSGVVKPEVQIDWTDLKTDTSSLNLIALDHVLVRPLPDPDGPRLCARPEPHLNQTDPHTRRLPVVRRAASSRRVTATSSGLIWTTLRSS